MGNWLDIVGSFIIGISVILMITMMNIKIQSNARNTMFDTYTQRDAATASVILENEFFLIGYGLPDENISIADSNRIMFYGDIDNNGVMDTVYYYEGSADQMVETENINDKPLFRKLNSANPKVAFPLRKFRLSYYSSFGTQLGYAELLDSLKRDEIRSIKILLNTESAIAIDGSYKGTNWERVITPKNFYINIQIDTTSYTLDDI